MKLKANFGAKVCPCVYECTCKVIYAESTKQGLWMATMFVMLTAAKYSNLLVLQALVD